MDKTINNFLMTIATRKPKATTAFLLSEGYPQATSIEVVFSQLNNYVTKFGKEAINKLAMIHPDKSLIIEAYEATTKGLKSFEGEDSRLIEKTYKESNEKNCGGCMAALALAANGKAFSAEGNNNQGQNFDMSKIWNALIITGAIVVGLSLFTAMNFSRARN